MAWELQQHMHQYVAPSILAEYNRLTEAGSEKDAQTWLVDVYATQRQEAAQAEIDKVEWRGFEYEEEYDEEVAALPDPEAVYKEERQHALDMLERGMLDMLIYAVAEYAIERASATSNGAHAVYLDAEGYFDVPWCTDEELEEYYG